MIHKIAVLSDVHGNQTALEAVFADAHANGATDFWFLGDLLLPGPGGEALFELLEENNVSVYVRGNWEDCFLAALDGNVDLTDETDVYFVQLSHYLLDHISPSRVEFIRQLPLQTIKEVNGLIVSLTHHLPQKNYGPELHTFRPVENFAPLFQEFEADIAIYGHIHHQVLRYSSNDQLILNPGSIGQPVNDWYRLHGDLRAQYMFLTIDEAGIADIDFKRVRYDTSREIKRAEEAELSYLELYKTFFTTGYPVTHDISLLKDYGHRFGYHESAIQFLKSLGHLKDSE
ncbi:MAG TPA: metallophosphatase family protein [Bavariicoccus seileri]|uniref:Metallophosphatase family protein n=1 Tax=Bavariicoccus seileri TaxID=549685 RepID=A0A3D4S3I1_9ENTE|nr:metallophosphoesterase family protein [Bavariicoccus seileri]HCS93357.1 metallophosphatase family protein [Bavariicoccus seileri]